MGRYVVCSIGRKASGLFKGTPYVPCFSHKASVSIRDDMYRDNMIIGRDNMYPYTRAYTLVFFTTKLPLVMSWVSF